MDFTWSTNKKSTLGKKGYFTPGSQGFSWSSAGGKQWQAPVETTAKYLKTQSVSNNLKNFDKLNTKEQYDTLREARNLGLIDKKTHIETIKWVGANAQKKTKEAYEMSLNPLEKTIGSFTKDIVSNPNAAVAAATEAMYKPTIQSGVQLANIIESGFFNTKEATRRTQEFMKSIGLEKPALSSGFDRNSAAFKAGQTAGNVVREGGELGAALIPGIGLTKVLSTIPKVAKTGKAGAIGANIVGDLLSTGIQSVQDVSKGKNPNLLENALIAVAADTGLPLAGSLIKKLKTVGVEKGGSLVSKALTKAGYTLEKTETGRTIVSVKDKLAQKLVDNLHYISKPFAGMTDSTTGRQVVEEIRGLATNVRQATGLAKSYRDNNKPFQELISLVKSGGKKSYADLGDFIKNKQSVINRIKLGEKLDIPKGSAIQEKAYKLLNQSTKDDVQRAFDAGLLDKATYKKFMADENYTRVQRNMEDVLNFRGMGNAEASVKSTVLQQKLKGSSKEVIDPFASYIDWSNRITTQIERNKFANYVTDKLVENNMATLAKTGNTDTIGRFKNGVKELFVTDPEIANSITNMDKIALGALQKYAVVPSRLLQAGATGFNLAFSVPNIIRDELSSLILSKNALATHNPISIFQGIKEAIFKPSVNALARGTKLAGKGENVWKPSKLYQEYLSKNMQMTTADLARELKTATRQSLEEFGIKGENVLRKVEAINTASEKMGRFQNFYGTYKKALNSGLDEGLALDRAMQAARENSVDFSQRGEISTFMRLFNPYFNASVQGSRSLARALKERPVATSLKIGATLMLPVAGTTYYNLSDPKRAVAYARIPQYVRNNNLVFVMADGNYIKLPLPPGVSECAKPLRNLIESEYLGDRQSLLETARNLLVDPFNPASSFGDVIPQAIRPVVENMANYSFFKGEPVIPKSLQDLPPGEQTYEKTAPLYKDLGNALGMSPLQVQNLITGYGAGGTEQLVNAVDAARRNKPEELMTDRRGLVGQIKGRFVGTTNETNNAVTDKFYKEYTPLKAQQYSISNKITKLVKDNKIAEAKKLASEFNKKIDSQNSQFKTTYGKYESGSELLDTLNNLKFNLTDRSIKSRKRQK